MAIKYLIKNQEQKYYIRKNWGQDLEYIADRNKAKAFKDLGKIKVHFLHLIGYYNNISAGNSPEWLYNPYPILSIPEDWQIIKYDSNTKIEEIVNFDFNKYIDQQLKLRLLIPIYGVLIKDLYKKIEEKNELNNYKIILVFKFEVKNQLFFSTELLRWKQQIEDACKLAQVKRNDRRTVQKNLMAAIAFKDPQKAMMVKLTFEGDTSISVLDVKNLIEVAEEMQVRIINGQF